MAKLCNDLNLESNEHEILLLYFTHIHHSIIVVIFGRLYWKGLHKVEDLWLGLYFDITVQSNL